MRIADDTHWTLTGPSILIYLFCLIAAIRKGELSVIKAWDFEFNAPPGKAIPDYEDREAIQRAFNFNMDLMASHEQRGFEGVFFSEHHFIASLSPTPNLLVATLAARTQRLKIGVMGNVLPFHQPWRIAEELALLDYITEGRLEIGVASGIPPEFLFVNIPQPDIRPMFAEGLDFLQEAETNGVASLKGKYYDYEDIPISPRPRIEERRRHWIPIYSEATCREAVRRNFKVCTGFQTVAKATVAFDGYRDEAAKLGRTVGPDDIGVRRQILIWDSHDEAVALNKELQESANARLDVIFQAVFQRLRKEGETFPDPAKQSGVIDAAAVPREQGGDAPKPPTAGSNALPISPDEFITGSPSTVAEQIIDQCRRMGAGNILAYHCATMDEQQILRNYTLWEKVIPILRKADVFTDRVAAA